MRHTVAAFIIFALGVAFGHSAIAAGAARTGMLGSSIDHREAIESYRKHVQTLQAKINKVRLFIEAAENKTYRDPKGLKRAHWRRLVGSWQRQLDESTRQIAWHAAQLDAL